MAIKHLVSKPFLTGNMSDKYLPTKTLLQVSFRHVFIGLASFHSVCVCVCVCVCVRVCVCVCVFKDKPKYVMIPSFPPHPRHSPTTITHTVLVQISVKG